MKTKNKQILIKVLFTLCFFALSAILYSAVMTICENLFGAHKMFNRSSLIIFEGLLSTFFVLVFFWMYKRLGKVLR